MMVKKALALMRQGSALAASLATFECPWATAREILLFCDEKFMQTTLDFIGKSFRVLTILIVNGTSTEDDKVIRFTSYKVGRQQKNNNNNKQQDTSLFKSAFKCTSLPCST